MALGLADLGVEARVPPRGLGELARYGMSADASQIRRHPARRPPVGDIAGHGPAPGGQLGSTTPWSCWTC
jgi:hypothetical protein